MPAAPEIGKRVEMVERTGSGAERQSLKTSLEFFASDKDGKLSSRDPSCQVGEKKPAPRLAEMAVGMMRTSWITHHTAICRTPQQCTFGPLLSLSDILRDPSTKNRAQTPSPAFQTITHAKNPTAATRYIPSKTHQPTLRTAVLRGLPKQPVTGRAACRRR